MNESHVSLVKSKWIRKMYENLTGIPEKPFYGIDQVLSDDHQTRNHDLLKIARYTVDKPKG
jgi:hypothetical protein